MDWPYIYICIYVYIYMYICISCIYIYIYVCMCRNFTLCKDPYLNKKHQGTQINMLGLDEKFSNDRSWGLKILTLHVQRDDWQPLRFLQQTVASNFRRNSRGVKFECYFLDDVGTYLSTLLYNKSG